MVKFLRRTWYAYVKLGKGNKKNQKWRKPTGRDNKLREKKKGYGSVVSIGYGSDKDSRDTLKGKSPVMVNNINDLQKVGKDNIAVLGSVGGKKKIAIIEKAKGMKVEFYNVNIASFLKKNKLKGNNKK